MKITYILFFGLTYCYLGMSQNINTDSLLVEGLKSFKTKNYEDAVQQGRLGIKLAPYYNDFYMLLGRTFTKMNKIESAKYYFYHVIETAPEYKEAFVNAINLENSTQNYKKALLMTEKALDYYKDDRDFCQMKLKSLQLLDEVEPLINYLERLVIEYPNDDNFQKLLREQKSKFISDRIGIEHSYSMFNRKGVGPWNLTGIQYIRERKKSTFIGQINYTDRRVNGSSLRSGYQFVLESYIKSGEKGTFLANVAYSDNNVFPDWRLSYSYLHNFDSGWEIESGIRYIKPNEDKNIYAAALGIGKYIGSSWLNVTSFLFFDEGENYFSLGGTYRYYFNTKYDYIAVLAGYGSSPDQSQNITLFNEQVSLDSYRVGVAYNSLLGNKIILGLQLIANRQEYVQDKIQNQFDFFASIQYRL